MEKRKTLSKKTKEKLQWLKENKNNYLFDYDLRDALSKQFNLNPIYAYRILDLFNGKIDNTTDRNQQFRNKEDKPFFNENKCYFCNIIEELITHHISYNPERFVLLCKSCHNKIHHIMEEQHKIEQERALIYLENNERIQKIKDILR